MGALWFQFDADKFMQAAVYLTEQCPAMTKMKLFKLLFFADKKHLCEYGRPIVGGRYVAMKDGPVHSEGYDIIKGGRHQVHQYLGIKGRNIEVLQRSGNLQALSDSDEEVLTEIARELGHISAEQLSEMSHQDPAWNSRPRNADMLYSDFLRGCDPAVLEQINEDQQVRDLVNDVSLSEEPVRI